MNEQLHRAPVGVVETTADGVVTDVNEPALAVLETDRSALVDADVRDVFPESAAGTLREAFAGGTPSERSFEEYYPRLERWLAVDVDVGERVRVYVRDRTEYHDTERTVERLERRLDRVQEIDALVLSVLERLVDVSDRVEVAETVCEHLGGADPYTFAWIGDRDFAADRLRAVATAGSAPELRERIDEYLGGDDVLPAQAAVAAGGPRLARSLPEDDDVPRSVRRAAFGHGLQSCLAVPLAYQGTVYGVLSVYSREEAGFSEQERAGLETLGRVAGFAINALRREDLLVADSVTEVTLELRDGDVPFVRAAREAGASLSLDGAVPRGDGAVVCYLTLDEAEADDAGGTEAATDVDRARAAVTAALGADDAVEAVRWVREEGTPLSQVAVVGDTPVTALAAWGATVRSAVYDGETAQVVAAAPPDESVRRLVEAVDATVAETALLSKEERVREGESVEAFRDSLAERLTERQQTVLRTAYLSEYFASPRGSSSEEVAETLDITGPTMLYHLRRAQRKLAEAFFETDPGTAGVSDVGPDRPGEDS